MTETLLYGAALSSAAFSVLASLQGDTSYAIALMFAAGGWLVIAWLEGAQP